MYGRTQLMVYRWVYVSGEASTVKLENNDREREYYVA